MSPVGVLVVTQSAPGACERDHYWRKTPAAEIGIIRTMRGEGAVHAGGFFIEPFPQSADTTPPGILGPGHNSQLRRAICRGLWPERSLRALIQRTNKQPTKRGTPYVDDHAIHRFKSDKLEEMIKTAKQAKTIFEMSRFHTGAWAGEWLIVSRYASW